jgi:hypothetical protein
VNRILSIVGPFLLAITFGALVVSLPWTEKATVAMAAEEPKEERPRYLMTDAKVLEKMDDGWWIISFRGEKYLYRSWWHEMKSDGSGIVMTPYNGRVKSKKLAQED